MRTILSKIRLGYFTLRALVSDLIATKRCFDTLIARASTLMFPISNPCPSFWQKNPPFPNLVDMKSENLPGTTDIIIIGSGISGASVAYSILNGSHNHGKAQYSPRVMIIEAREVCSGATGRNGGHIKCSAYMEYFALKARFGMKKATELLEFQRQHMPILLDLIRQKGLKIAEAREVETVDIFTDEQTWNEAKSMVQQLREDLPGAAKDIVIHDGMEGCEKFQVDPQHCHGIITYSAAALWPYRFVTALYASLLSTYPSSFFIEAKTMVTDVKINFEDSDKPFLVHTSRGKISATHVVHATDGFAATLVPGLKGKLFPVRGHMTAQTPGNLFPKPAGSRSWCVFHNHGFDYISQRPGKGELMVGGGMVQSPQKGMDEFGIWRDDQMSVPILAYLNGLLPTIFGTNNWGVDESPGTKQAWSGCMGFTTDLLPYVGKLNQALTHRKLGSSYKDHKAAEWISAGFHGEGMILAWLSGVAVGLMIVGDEEEDFLEGPGIPGGKVRDWLPREMICSKRRVDRSSVSDLAMLL